MGRRFKILISDAGYKHTLGAVRSLGKAGFHVIAMSSNKYAQSFFSRYCRERLVCPSLRDEQRYIQFLKTYLTDHPVDVFIPIGLTTTIAISRHKDELSSLVRVPVANFDSMQIARHKMKTMHLAKELGVPTPREYTDIREIQEFPVVVKGVFKKVQYANSMEELRRIDLTDSIVQEYIPGEGFGFFGLFNQSRLRAFFMHKRIREYPITGGPSSSARSVYSDEMKRYGTALLEALNWHGVAMVEFRKDQRDGKYKLMEINPKFWGSLELSIASGVNFPVLLANMALNGDIEPVFEYPTDVIYHWPFPNETLQMLADPSSVSGTVRDWFQKNSYSNLWIHDPLPNMMQLAITSYLIVDKTIIHRSLQFPQGCPKVHGKPEIQGH